MDRVRTGSAPRSPAPPQHPITSVQRIGTHSASNEIILKFLQRPGHIRKHR
jgi:hypothetical protein